MTVTLESAGDRLDFTMPPEPPFRWLEAPGATINIRYVEGQKRDHRILFFHGLLGDSKTWDIFDPFVPPWGYADCYFFDFHFERVRPEATTFQRIIDETEQLLTTHVPADGPPMTVVGNSFGGHIALWFTSLQKLRPRNMVLFAPGGIKEVVGDRNQYAAYRTVDKILEVSFDRIFNDPSVRARPEIVKRIQKYRDTLEPNRKIFAKNLVQLARAIKGSLVTHEALHNIDARTTLVWGNRDQITPPKVAEVMRTHIPNSQVVWVDAGHAPHIECPDVASKLLYDVVKGLPIVSASPMSA